VAEVQKSSKNSEKAQEIDTSAQLPGKVGLNFCL